MTVSAELRICLLLPVRAPCELVYDLVLTREQGEELHARLGHVGILRRPSANCEPAEGLSRLCAEEKHASIEQPLH